MNMNSRHPRALPLIPAVLSTLLSVGAAQAADAAPPPAVNAQQLEQQIEVLTRQLDALKGEVEQLKKQNDALATQQQQQAVEVQQVAETAKPQGGIPPELSLWGYGEIYYTHPVHVPDKTEADLARGVFGIGYRFDDNTVFNSEYEVEHAVASSSDVGEFEIEQFYVDHQLAPWVGVKGGLFLMPFGLLNEHHEPTNFYGVQRNFVETLIIPSTWREGGFAFHGDTAIGLTWDVGLTTDQNLGKRNFFPEDPGYRTALDLEDNDVAPLQETHQELSLANAQHLAQYVSLNYKGVPGLLAGAAVFTGNVAVPTFPKGLPGQRVTLWETHARWTPGPFDFSAVFARGSITNTQASNIANSGATNPEPASFHGWFVQAAWNAWHHNGYRAAPFVRFETYDMGASFEGIAPGFTPVPTTLASDGQPWPMPYDRVWTTGLNFYVTPHVVLKGDFQSFRNNSDLTRFDLGLGLNF